MKRTIIALCLLIASATARAETVRDFFISEPDRVFELLSQGVRAAMITMAEQGQQIQTDNFHGGVARIDSLSENYISVRCSDAEQVELKMLTKGKRDTVIAVVETLLLPSPDSRISFYDAKWQQLPTKKHMSGGEVKMADFIKSGTPAAHVAEINRIVRFPIIKLTFGQADGVLVATHQLKGFSQP